MVDSIRKLVLVAIAIVLAATFSPARADDPPVQDKPKAKPPRTLDDIPTPFVPLHPRTVEDQNRVEALRLYTAARALEDKFQIGGPRGGDLRGTIDDAIGLLEKAEKLDPNSTSILRRLSKLCFVVGKKRPGRDLRPQDPGA